MTTCFGQVPDGPELRRSDGAAGLDDELPGLSRTFEDATSVGLGVRGEQPSSRDGSRLLLEDVDGPPFLQEGGLRVSKSSLKRRTVSDVGTRVAAGVSVTDEQAEMSASPGLQQRMLKGTAERDNVPLWRVKLAWLLGWVAGLPRGWLERLVRLVRRWRAQDVHV